MKRYSNIFKIIAVASAPFFLPSLNAHAATFTGLGVIDTEYLESRNPHVSGDGLVVGGSSNHQFDHDAFRWTAATGMQKLTGLPTTSIVTGLSYDGSVLVGRFGGTPSAYRWDTTSGYIYLGDLPGGSTNSVSMDVSDDGNIIAGQSSSNLGLESFRWTTTNPVVRSLSSLQGPAFLGIPNGVSGDGQTVVGWATSSIGTNEAYLWTITNGIQFLRTPPGPNDSSEAADASVDGSVVVGNFFQNFTTREAFRWTEGTGMQGLGDLPGGLFNSRALDVSADGSVIVGSANDGDPVAMIWDAENGMRKLQDVLIAAGLGQQLAGWTLTSATGISNDGRTIVGNGNNPAGTQEVWMATGDFSAPTFPETYYILNDRLALASLDVMSLTDGNQITVNGSTINADTSGPVSVGTVAQGGTVSGTNAFSLGSAFDATDLPVPERFFGTEFVIPDYRNDHTYFLLSPNQNTTATITIDGVATPVNLTAGIVSSVFGAGSNSQATLISSNDPILVAHLGSNGGANWRDAFPVPPAETELVGIYSRNVVVATTQANTNITVFTSQGQSQSYVLANVGDQLTLNLGSNAGEGAGSAYRIIADQPIGAIQAADSDGIESTAFMGASLLGTHYGLPLATQYVAIACPQPDTHIEMRDGTSVTEVACGGDTSHPGKAYFGSTTDGANIAAGTLFEANKPIYLYYEASISGGGDEHNLLGFNLPSSKPQQPMLIADEGILRNASYTITGSTAENAQVDLYRNGVFDSSTTADTSGSFTFNISLQEGSANFFARTNEAGNESFPSNTLSTTYIPTGRHERYLLNPGLLSNSIEIVSLVSNNTLYAGNISQTLAQYQTLSIPASELSQGMVIWGSGAFSLASNVNATDTLPANTMLGSEFVIPHYRNSHYYYLYSPNANADVTVTVDGVTTVVPILKGQVAIHNAGNTNNIAGVVTATQPIAVSHLAHNGSGGSLIDANPVPPASTELWGVRNTNARVGATQDGTVVTVTADNGATQTLNLDAGDSGTISIGVSGSQGSGSGIHLQSNLPIAAIQAADGDGSETTAFWDTSYLSSNHSLPVGAQYIVVVCPSASTTVTVDDNGFIENQACNANGAAPGKVIFNSTTYTAGTSIVSTNPVYVMYEASANNDEHNLLGE